MTYLQKNVFLFLVKHRQTESMEGSSEFYTMDAHNMCIEKLKEKNMKRKEDDWCFERYNCPRFTTPDNEGNVILDYGISVED